MSRQKGSDRVLTRTAGKIVADLLDTASHALRQRGAVAMKAIGALTLTKSEARKELESFIRDNLDRLEGTTEREREV